LETADTQGGRIRRRKVDNRAAVGCNHRQSSKALFATYRIKHDFDIAIRRILFETDAGPLEDKLSTKRNQSSRHLLATALVTGRSGFSP